MENSKFKQLCGKINYNTYNNIQNTLWISSAGLILTNGFILQQYPMLNEPIDVLIYSTLAANLAMTCSNGKNYTKDITEIRKLYEEFIKNYNQLNRTFDLNDPIQIYTMFNFLLYKGYLSKDKNFEFSSKQARDIDGLDGANVITGKAVCRHISAMLTNVLNDYGIESSQLGVYSRTYSIQIKFLDEQKYTKAELTNWVRTHITDESTHEFVMELIDELVDKRNQNIEISSQMIDIKNPFIRMIGNHAISFAFKDGKSYFLDPTQTRIYRMSELKKGILCDEECELPMRLGTSIVLDSPKDFLKMRERILQQYPSVSNEAEKSMVAETLDICNNNMNIFEQFYDDNSELYNDISAEVLKIKKRKSFIK